MDLIPKNSDLTFFYINRELLNEEDEEWRRGWPLACFTSFKRERWRASDIGSRRRRREEGFRLDEKDYLYGCSIYGYNKDVATKSLPNYRVGYFSSTCPVHLLMLKGVKDASDKKILVDMLFWAVDNPAPANYLLISGDRDFSNALHQLRMRKYNILLAQPQKASAPLVAAAKNVWLWTSLVAGGPPLTNGESAQFVSNSYDYLSNSDPLHIPVTDSRQINQHVDSFSEGMHLGNQKFSDMGKGTDSKQKGKIRKNLSQPFLSGSSSASIGIEEDRNNSISRQPGYAHPMQFKDSQASSVDSDPKIPFSRPAPSFIPGTPDSSWDNINTLQHPYQNHYSLPVRPNNLPMPPAFAPSNMFPPTSLIRPHLMPPRSDAPPSYTSGPPMNVPDIGKLKFSEHRSSNYHSPISKPRNGGELKQTSMIDSPINIGLSSHQKGHTVKNTQNNRSPHGGPAIQPPFSSAMDITNTSGSGVWGTVGCPKPSEYIQGLIGVVLLALNTLKTEKIMPIEANIADCIRYGDPRHRNTDVKKALESAVEQQLVVKQNVGALQLYVGKNGKLWNCVNPIAGNPKQYSKATWDEIQKFLSSSAGRSAIMASQCRYEAATIMKNMCLKDVALGDILQILHLVINMKKWITHHQSGWQPIKINSSRDQL
ncbi:unnamed protein product [Ilex paraguariensis]|uniref:NYN domain-containing protein n=1 Tax=Ilex paraguariensis TaxID=185542 RepID=A0ABC8UYF9_9AQUA